MAQTRCVWASRGRYGEWSGESRDRQRPRVPFQIGDLETTPPRVLFEEKRKRDSHKFIIEGELRARPRAPRSTRTRSRATCARSSARRLTTSASTSATPHKRTPQSPSNSTPKQKGPSKPKRGPGPTDPTRRRRLNRLQIQIIARTYAIQQQQPKSTDQLSSKRATKTTRRQHTPETSQTRANTRRRPVPKRRRSSTTTHTTSKSRRSALAGPAATASTLQSRARPMNHPLPVRTPSPAP